MSKSSKTPASGRVFFADSCSQQSTTNKGGNSMTGVKPSRTDLQRYKKTYGFNEQRIALFVEVFSVFDKDGDGVVTPSELSSVCMSLGHRPTSRQQLNQMIRAVDPDNRGSISFDKFVAVMARQQMNGSNCDDIEDEELRQVFNVFDFDADGLITAQELAEVLRRLGENMTADEIKEMIKEADTNGDGAIDYTEFKHILRAK